MPADAQITSFSVCSVNMQRYCCRVAACRNWWSIGWFLATRSPFMCAAVYFTKHLVKKHLLEPHANGRRKRLVKAATFVMDELIPVSFYGPLLTCGLLAHKMVKELEDS